MNEQQIFGLAPGPECSANSDQCVMDTTLRFEEYHFSDGRIEVLIASGQFTTCFNLIEYICKLEKKNRPSMN